MVAAGLAVTAAAAVTAAPKLFSSSGAGSTVVDRTYSCRVARTAEPPWFELTGSVTTTGPHPFPAYVYLRTVQKIVVDRVVSQVAFLARRGSGLDVDRAECRPSAANPALTSRGLGQRGTVTSTYLGLFGRRCPSAPRVTVRVRLRIRNGKPASAQLAVRDTRPLAYVDWSPSRVSYAVANRCVTYP